MAVNNELGKKLFKLCEKNISSSNIEYLTKILLN